MADPRFQGQPDTHKERSDTLHGTLRNQKDKDDSRERSEECGDDLQGSD